MAVVAYTRGLEALIKGDAKLGAVTVKALLWRSGYVPSKNDHAFRSAVNAEVPAGAGYAAGGVNAPSTVVLDSANSRVELRLGAASWLVPAGATLLARGLSWYISLGAVGSDILLAYNDFTTDRSATNQFFNVAAGVVRLQN